MISSPFAAGFTWSADNWTSFANDIGVAGVLYNANAKAAVSQLLAGLAEDCYFIEVIFTQGQQSAGSWNTLADIVVDTGAGVGGTGATWTVVIPNLAAHNPEHLITTSTRFGFPVFIPKGAAVGVQVQGSAAGSFDVACRVYGKPQRPEAIMVGQKVQALGITLASTTGTAFTPGTNAKGSYSATLGTLARNSWWWQVGIFHSSTALGASSHLIDVAFDATSKYLALQDMFWMSDAAENCGGMADSGMLPMHEAPAGADVYVRGACLSGAPVAGFQGIVYALG